MLNPYGEWWVFLVVLWHISCISGRETVVVLLRYIQDENKMVDSPKQLTVTMFFNVVLQLLELRIPRLVIAIELETNFVEHPFSFLIHFAIFETCTQIIDPTVQLWIFLVLLWHIACNSGREGWRC
jgi:hypothetical protein